MAIFNKNTPAERKPNWLRRTGVPAVVASLAITGCSVESDNSAENNAPIIPSSELAEPSQATKPSETSAATIDQDRVEEASSVNTPESSSSAIDLSAYPKPTTYEELLDTPYILNGVLYEEREDALESCLIPTTATPTEAIDKLKTNLDTFAHIGQTYSEAEHYHGFMDRDGSPEIKVSSTMNGVAVNAGAKIEYDYRPLAVECFGNQDLAPYLANILVTASSWSMSVYKDHLAENEEAPAASLELLNETVLNEDTDKPALVADFVFRDSKGRVIEEISNAFSIQLERVPQLDHWSITKVAESQNLIDLLPQPTN